MAVSNAYPPDIDIGELEHRVEQDERGLGPLVAIATTEVAGRPVTGVSFETALGVEASVSSLVLGDESPAPGRIRFVRGNAFIRGAATGVMVHVPHHPGLLAQRAILMLIADGWSFEHAVGIAANIDGESKFDPAARGDGGTALGLCQWRLDRQVHFEHMQGRSLEGSTFAEQVAYITWEMENHETEARDELRATRDVRAAAEAVCRFYERPADPDGDSRRRADVAERLAAMFG